MRKIKTFLTKLFKAVLFTYTTLSGIFVWFDFLISSESEFMSLEIEKFIFYSFLVSFLLTLTLYINEQKKENN